jgi:hypothetical protein
MPRARKQRITRQSGGDVVNPIDASTLSQITAVSTPTDLRAQLDAKQAELDALQGKPYWSECSLITNYPSSRS